MLAAGRPHLSRLADFFKTPSSRRIDERHIAAGANLPHGFEARGGVQASRN
jgi:hypothetical protein